MSTKQRESIIETNIAFSSIRKRQVVAIRPSASSDIVRIVVKGAPEYVMPMCTRHMDEYGNDQYLDSS
jgi:magnesium-transporting ATPase (P-type)